ncbi:MAG: hypothetical protein QMD71_01500 [bacterium]|nr:hypothetical protein [bacterium]
MKRLHLPRYEFTARDVRTGVSAILMGRPKMGLTPQSLQAMKK